MNDNERINDNSGSAHDQVPAAPNSAVPAGASASPTDPTVEVPADPAASAPHSAPDHTTAKPRRRGASRPVLWGVGAGVALLLVGGVGLAVGMEIGEDLDSSSSQQGSDEDRDERADDGEGDRRDEARSEDRDDDRGESGQSGDLAASDVESLSGAATAALDATGGAGVSSIDVERGGYEVEVRFDDDTDADVFVSADGDVSEPRGRDEGTSAEPVLDLERLDAIADAASSAAPAADGEGTIDAISTSDDDAAAFEVTLRYPDGREFEAALADDLSVVSTDLDD
ncbi:hypothetical protein [Microbacterium sp.]|uniref:hypothetical protein n=1 Tax=Microbacterium sp. TaxID=51671 RepID=UPI002812518B|nr:hypothetical protein [Microbacterium sp.]